MMIQSKVLTFITHRLEIIHTDVCLSLRVFVCVKLCLLNRWTFRIDDFSNHSVFHPIWQQIWYYDEIALGRNQQLRCAVFIQCNFGVN